MDYSDYQRVVKDDVRQCLENMGCQPILFIGSGLARRYCGAPNWTELLEILAADCEIETKGIDYYLQMHDDKSEIGSILSKLYTDWAWGSGKNNFPQELFSKSYRPDIYIKHKISSVIHNICNNFNALSSPFIDEINKLQNIKPHALITTNYDNIIENIFPAYSRVIGQKIIRANYVSYGEIYKIHGCCSQPDSIVFTKEDYQNFSKNKKYLSAKLLTYFAEHPLLFIGYSAADKNISSILSDIDEILSQGDDIIPNIYILEWKEKISNKFEKLETIIPTQDEKQIRIKSIVSDDFSWVFDAFYGGNIETSVDPKMLRRLMANTYKLVRHDFPRKDLKVDFQLLESACSSTDGLAKLFGITVLNSPESLSAQYPYLISQMAHKLGFSHWMHAHKLMKEIEDRHGVNFKESDNQYHITIKTGNISSTHKYSIKMFDLLNRAENNNDYTIETLIQKNQEEL
ncbi:MAG: SIR2 family protein [Desulfovibrio sp.]|uniref:SIR2 family NAD-dependent protein deacylase n=1 Tax=Desulfovibrio sp. TaxID=885 RepID=UPI00135E1732|nr:SIR2 family protein [Desulfovibrio sp.]MTJ92234.1 SIR2 family protein [Desulfovibrio sp.]